MAVSVPLSAIRTVFERILGSVLENELGGVTGIIFGVSLGAS